MNIFLDVELTDWHGDIISIGMISDDGKEFYKELEFSNPSKWVVDNVLPKLSGKPLSLSAFQSELTAYFKQFDSCNIVVDWPEDIRAITSLFTNDYRYSVLLPVMTFEIFNTEMPENKGSHNALYDAKELRLLYVN